MRLQLLVNPTNLGLCHQVVRLSVVRQQTLHKRAIHSPPEPPHINLLELTRALLDILVHVDHLLLVEAIKLGLWLLDVWWIVEPRLQIRCT